MKNRLVIFASIAILAFLGVLMYFYAQSNYGPAIMNGYGYRPSMMRGMMSGDYYNNNEHYSNTNTNINFQMMPKRVKNYLNHYARNVTDSMLKEKLDQIFRMPLKATSIGP
ncbi:hypothetical protein DESACE_09335 [Desulfurella acetivorans A63]|nr:hypothetical protein DESACE_09335 [Desulfurella acetivorans A63]